jgi:hypothetical protein
MNNWLASLLLTKSPVEGAKMQTVTSALDESDTAASNILAYQRVLSSMTDRR